jgi:hypothetical protein
MSEAATSNTLFIGAWWRRRAADTRKTPAEYGRCGRGETTGLGECIGPAAMAGLRDGLASPEQISRKA